MGHETAYRTVVLHNYGAALLGGDGKVSVDKVLRIAINEWENDYDESRGDENAGTPYVLPATSGKYASEVVHLNHDEIPNHSVIVPIVASSDVTEVSKKASLKLSGELIGRLQIGNGERELLELAYKTFGSHVVGAKVAKLPKPLKAVATATDGKAVTKYKIVAVDNTWFKPSYRDFKLGFVSQAEARKEAIRLVNSEQVGTITEVHEKSLVDLEIHAYIERDSGSAAVVKVSRPKPVEAEVAVIVTYVTPKANAEPISYAVAFDYHR